MTDPRLRAELVAEGLGSGFAGLVSAATFLDHDTLLISTRPDGRVRRVDLVPGAVVAPGATVIDLDVIMPSPTDGQSEYGVQGIALHPQFTTNGWVYIRYDRSIAPPGDTPQSAITEFVTPMFNVTERYTWDGAANNGAGVLALNASIRAAAIMTRTHHGGMHAFGPDGRLYTLFGDQRLVNELSMNGAAGLYSFTDVSVVTRLNDDGSPAAGNPFGPGSGAPSPAATASWFGYGVRNPFALAFDPVTGDLWITDNGEASFDEITRTPIGFNSGATRIYGPLADPRQQGNLSQLQVLPGSVYVDPAYSWWRTCGVTGIAFLAGSALGPVFDDRVLVGNYNNGYLWMLRLNATRTGFVFDHPDMQAAVDNRDPGITNPVGTPAQEVLAGTGFGGVFSGTVHVLRSPDGWPYVLTATGRLYRIVRACPADLVEIGGGPGPDGHLTLDDILAFINAYNDGEGCPRTPGTGPCAIADLCGIGGSPALPDGQLTLDDILEFVNAYNDGCP